MVERHRNPPGIRCEAKTARNLELWRRVHRGETRTALARDLGISNARAQQIFDAVERRVQQALNSTALGVGHSEPYVYDAWFTFELGKPKPRIKPD